MTVLCLFEIKEHFSAKMYDHNHSVPVLLGKIFLTCHEDVLLNSACSVLVLIGTNDSVFLTNMYVKTIKQVQQHFTWCLLIFKNIAFWEIDSCK